MSYMNMQLKSFTNIIVWDTIPLSVLAMYNDLLHIKHLLLTLSPLEVLLSKGHLDIFCWLSAKDICKLHAGTVYYWWRKPAPLASRS